MPRRDALARMPDDGFEESRGGGLRSAVARLSILLTGSFASSGLAFVTQLLLARLLSLDAFGGLAALLAAVNFLTPVAAAGMNWFLLRAYGTEGPAARRWLRPAGLLVAVTTTLSAVALLAYAGLGGSLPADQRVAVLLACVPVLLGQVAVELASARLQLEERFTGLTALQAATQVGRFLVLAAAVAASSATLGAVLFGYALVGVVTAVSGGILLGGLWFGRARLVGHEEWLAKEAAAPQPEPSLRRAAAESAPYSLVTMFYVLYFQGMVVVLDWLAGGGEAAAFNAGFLIIQATALIPGVVYTRLLAARLNRWAEHDPERFRDVFQLGVAAMLVAGLVVMLGVALLAGPGVVVLFGPRFAAATPILLILAVGIPVRFVQMAYSSLYVSRRDTLRKARYLGLGALASVAAGVALVPAFGGTGAAVACVLAEVVLLVLHARGAAVIVGRAAALGALRPHAVHAALGRLRHGG